MKFFKKTAVLLLVMATFFSCSKSDTSAPASTDLKITVFDHLGNPVSGATIKLYASATDLTNAEAGSSQNQVGVTQTTDVTGVTTFKNLNPVQYYWLVQGGCQTNVFTTYTTTSPLIPNVTTSVVTQVNSTGTLKMVNTSSNPYHLYINGQLITDIPGNTTVSVPAATGAYTIRVVQVSGFAVTPTDKTYTGNVTCGGILTTTFP